VQLKLSSFSSKLSYIYLNLIGFILLLRCISNDVERLLREKWKGLHRLSSVKYTHKFSGDSWHRGNLGGT